MYVVGSCVLLIPYFTLHIRSRYIFIYAENKVLLDVTTNDKHSFIEESTYGKKLLCDLDYMPQALDPNRQRT